MWNTAHGLLIFKGYWTYRFHLRKQHTVFLSEVSRGMHRVQPSWVAEGCPDARHRGGADYELIAVVHHLGRTPAAGHYTADVRQPDGKWLHFDDADLSNVPLARVVDDNKAYLLFYQLRE